MPVGNAFPMRNTIPDVTYVGGVWTGGGAATDCTQSSADWNKGILSVKYNAATGKYRITLADVGQQLVDIKIHVSKATTAAGTRVASYTEGSFSITNKTIDFEVADVATPSLVDLTTANKLYISIGFAKQKP